MRLVSFLAIALITSCQQQRPQENFNFYGGTSRASAYEQGGTFTTMVITDKPKGKSAENATKGAVVPPVPVTFNQNYLATIDGYAVRYAGNTMEWKTPLDTLPSGKRAVAAAFTAADNNDNFYLFASDGAAYSFDKTGKRRWKQPLFTPVATSLYSDILLLPSGIIAAFSDNGTRGMVVKIGLDGKILWQRTTTLAPTRTLAADEQGNIFLALSQNTTGATDSLVSLNADGTPRWGIAVPNTRIMKSPVLGYGMVLVAGVQEEKDGRKDIVRAFDAQTGKERWTKTLTVAAQGISVGTRENGEPLIVLAGYRIGLAEPLTLVVGLDAAGKEIWRLSYELAIIGAPMISSENIAFVGTKGDALGVYLMRKDGVFDRVVSLSEVQLLCLIPGVDIQNNLVFAMTEELGVIKVGSLPAQRLLPY